MFRFPVPHLYPRLENLVHRKGRLSNVRRPSGSGKIPLCLFFDEIFFDENEISVLDAKIALSIQLCNCQLAKPAYVRS